METFLVKQDALEIISHANMACPSEKCATVGQGRALLEEVSGWINEKAMMPIWAKMTPNIAGITDGT